MLEGRTFKPNSTIYATGEDPCSISSTTCCEDVHAFNLKNGACIEVSSTPGCFKNSQSVVGTASKKEKEPGLQKMCKIGAWNDKINEGRNFKDSDNGNGKSWHEDLGRQRGKMNWQRAHHVRVKSGDVFGP